MLTFFADNRMRYDLLEISWSLMLASESTEDALLLRLEASVVRDFDLSFNTVSYTHLDVYKRQKYGHLYEAFL